MVVGVVACEFDLLAEFNAKPCRNEAVKNFFGTWNVQQVQENESCACFPALFC